MNARLTFHNLKAVLRTIKNKFYGLILHKFDMAFVSTFIHTSACTYHIYVGKISLNT